MASKSPFAKTAKTILTRSLEDIEAGSWKRGEWGNGRSNGKCEIEMGCANGLISMHGGHINEITTQVENGKTYRVFQPAPANAAAYHPKTRTWEDAPAGVVKATKAVFAALPKTAQREYELLIEDGADELSAMVNTIIDWNDRPSTTKGKAAQVFRKAIEVLPTIK